MVKNPKDPKTKTQHQDQHIKDLKNQISDLSTQKLRALADYQNLQKRVEKDKVDFVKYANQKLLLQIIELKDIVDRAEIFITDPGLKIVKDQLVSLLKDNNVEEIDALGQEFDPETMECVDKNQTDNNLVAAVNQKGYRLFDKILRPAQVTVGQVEKK